MSFNAKIDSFIEDKAIDAMTIKHPAREYRTLIATLFTARYALMAFSVSAAYTYTSGLISAMAENITGFFLFFFSALVLVLIELISIGSAGYALKYTARKRYVNAVGFYLLAVVMLGVSFVLTTEGLAQQQAQKADNTVKIDTETDEQKKAIVSDYGQQIKEQLAAISLIQTNPQGWQDGKRSVLTRSQLKEIASIRAEISSLRKQKAESLANLKNDNKAAKKQNLQAVNAESDKYYKIGAGLMVGSVVVSVLLAVLFYIIFRHREGTKADMSDLRLWTQNMFRSMFSDTMSRQKEMSEMITTETQRSFKEFAVLSNEGMAIDTEHEVLNQKTTHRNDIPTPNPTHSATQNGGIGFKAQTSAKNLNAIHNGERNGERNREAETARFPHHTVHKTDGKRYFNDRDEKICPTCGAIVDKKHWNAIYCSDNCRKEAWEYRNGRKLIFKKQP